MNEFVFIAVPMTLAGPASGGQGHQIDAEVAKATGVAQIAVASAWRRVRRRVLDNPNPGVPARR